MIQNMSAGLRKTPIYEDIIEYIKKDPDKINYPNRYAKQLRNSFELSQVDGEGMRQMEQYELGLMKEREEEGLTLDDD